MVVSMTLKELEKMAQETAAFGVHPSGEYIYSFYTEQLQAFAKLVAQHEREACAKIVEANADACSTDSLAQMYLYSNANAIRAGGQA
jgi:hypothetical protein